MDIFLLIVLSYLLNIFIGFFMIVILDCFFDIPFNVLALSGGAIFLIFYGMYQLIRLPKILQERKIEKEKREFRKLKEVVMDYIIQNNLNNRLKNLMFDCRNVYFTLEKDKYKDIDKIHGSKFKKIFIYTINYITELEKQYGQIALDQNTDQIIETLTNLKEYLKSELETYEKEYLELTNKDKINVKKALDELNEKLKYFTEFNNKY